MNVSCSQLYSEFCGLADHSAIDKLQRVEVLLQNAIRSFYVYYIIRESLLKTCARVQLNSVVDDAFL